MDNYCKHIEHLHQILKKHANKNLSILYAVNFSFADCD